MGLHENIPHSVRDKLKIEDLPVLIFFIFAEPHAKNVFAS